MPIDEKMIRKMAEAGAKISGGRKYLTPSVRFSDGGWPRVPAALLERLRLLAIENIADLQQYRFADSSQALWNQQDWDAAIRIKLEKGPESRRIVFENPDREQTDYLLALDGFTVEPSGDGGWWVKHYDWRVHYYRRRGWAVKKAKKLQREKGIV